MNLTNVVVQRKLIDQNHNINNQRIGYSRWYFIPQVSW